MSYEEVFGVIDCNNCHALRVDPMQALRHE